MGKKLLRITMLVVLLFFTIANVVNALSCSASIASNKSVVQEGEEFIVTLKINNMDVGSSEGFSTIKGTLKYDNTVFETIGRTSFDKLNNWNPDFDAETSKLTLRTSIATKVDTAICQITFKVKSEVKSTAGKATTGTIKFEDITASTADADTSVSSVSQTITIAPPEGLYGNVNNTNKNSIPINSNDQGEVSYNNSVNKTEEPVPSAGAEDTAFILLVTVVIVGLVFYIKFEKLDKDITR